MKVTVAVCTWNRANLLDRALGHLEQLQVPTGVDWEVLVVNNNCSDHTDEVIARHSRRLPVKRLFEPRAGKSFAANLATSQATGELILWIDDDVLVEPNWMVEYLSAAQRWPDAAFFGGAVDLDFEINPPKWIRQHLTLRGPYSFSQRGEAWRRFAPGENPYGCNMALRASIQREFAFNTQLGRFEGEVLPGEDGELFSRLRRAGYWGAWVGTARVRHIVPADRLTRRYIWDWYRSHGRTEVLRGQAQDAVFFFGVPRWALREYLSSRLLSWLLFPSQGRRWVRAYTKAAHSLGVMQQARAAKLGNQQWLAPKKS